MSLVLEIEFLAGVAFAALGPDSAAPDWPPQPDRVFSALVATWGAHGEIAAERQALEWLEALPPPIIHASDAESRTAPVVFVPPNDPRSDRSKHALGVLPQRRDRQPRRFPAVRPHCATMHMMWVETAPEPATFAALQSLARDTAYIGHSASLTRCCFMAELPQAASPGRPPARGVYKRRLDELQRAYPNARPSPGASLRTAAQPAPVRRNVFDPRWLILEHIGGAMPDIRATALVAKTIRASLFCGYDDQPIPEAVSGHAPDGSPTRAPHLAIVPLPFAGFPYADGHVMGFALVPPDKAQILDDAGFRRALRKIATLQDQRRVMRIAIGPGSTEQGEIALALTYEPSRRSLDPSLYTAPARRFGSVTPIVLDRHLKKQGAAQRTEIEDQIIEACRRIGLPEPRRIISDKHSSIEGAPSAYPSGKAPPWMRWRLPSSLGSRQLIHAVIDFAEPVDGPVILGAGRFLGLGLCRPLTS
jgi:CRISPR-associated protein Csb2